MSDVLSRAKQDLEQTHQKAVSLRAQLARIEAEQRELEAFISRLEFYEAGNQAARVVTYGNRPTTHDGKTVVQVGKMKQRIPREGSKRYEIGELALEAIRERGPLHTTDLLPFIAPILGVVAKPQNYLSNALSKDARLEATHDGWTERKMASDIPEAI